MAAWLQLQPAVGTQTGSCRLCHRALAQLWQGRHFKEGAKGHAKHFQRCSYPERELVHSTFSTL